MSAIVEDMYLYSSALKLQQKHHQEFRKRHHSDSSDDDSSSPKSSSPSMDDDRRAHHNELERKRRDHIKDHFVILKDSIPLLDGEKSSRALILKRAVEYIAVMQSRLGENQKSIEELRRKNELLEDKLRVRETSVSPPNNLPTLNSPPLPVQMTLPVIHPMPQPISQVPQQLPHSVNPIALSAMDPMQLNSLIVSSQDAIIALTQSLFGKMATPSVPVPVPVSVPVSLPPTPPTSAPAVPVTVTSDTISPPIYSPPFSPPDQQVSVRF